MTTKCYAILYKKNGVDVGFANIDWAKFAPVAKATFFDTEEEALRYLIPEELEEGEEEFVVEFEIKMTRIVG